MRGGGGLRSLEEQECFGYQCKVGEGNSRPSSTSTRDLSVDERYTGPVLRSLRGTRVGMVGEGALRGDRCIRPLSSLRVTPIYTVDKWKIER